MLTTWVNADGNRNAYLRQVHTDRPPGRRGETVSPPNDAYLYALDNMSGRRRHKKKPAKEAMPCIRRSTAGTRSLT